MTFSFSALVHVVDSDCIARAQSDALANDFFVASVSRHDCFLVILRESHRIVVHHRVKVITGPKVTELFRIDLVEVGNRSRADVVPHDFNKLVAFRVAVHVIVAERVNQLMHNDSFVDAAVLIQRQTLTTSDLPQVRAASIARDNIYEVLLNSSLFETNTRVFLNIFHRLPYECFLVRC